MRPLPVLIPAALCAALVVGCGSSSSTSTGNLDGKKLAKETGRQAVTIDAADNVFEAQYTSVSPGTTVTFKNAGHNEHNVISVGGGFKDAKLLQPGDTYKVTFTSAGDFQFYCSLHGTPSSGMTGGLRVVK
jgi:plastocyanin